MGFHSALAAGMCLQLEQWSVGDFAPDGKWATGATVALAAGAQPTSGPAASCTVTLYDLPADAALADQVIGVQLLCRGRPGDRFGGVDIADSVFDHLASAAGFWLPAWPPGTEPSVYVVQAIHTTGSSLGADAESRWTWASSYHLYVSRPSRHRPD